MVPCAGTPLGVAQLHRLHGPLFLCLNRISSWFSARNAPCARLPYSQGPGAGRAEWGRRNEGWGGNPVKLDCDDHYTTTDVINSLSNKNKIKLN